MDIEHRVRSLERELRILRMACAVIAGGAIAWSCVLRREPVGEIAIGDVRVDAHGVTIGGGQYELAITSRGIVIHGQGGELGEQRAVLDGHSLALSAGTAAIELEAIGDHAQVFLHHVQQNKSDTWGAVTVRASKQNAEVETRVKVDDATSPAALLKADLDSAGVADISMRPKK